MKIGILGGGQLALMLAQGAERLKLNTKIISESDRVPARLSHCEFMRGLLNSPHDLKEFFSDLDIVTIENEFLSLEVIESSIPNTVKFYPSLKSLEITQNKLNQKYLFRKLNIATANFIMFDPKLDSLAVWLNKLDQFFAKGCVLKWAHGGYDGKGNFIFSSQDHLSEATAFCERALKLDTTIYAEELVPFKEELAMIFVRSVNGEFMFYPLVISEQEQNVCRTVYGPAISFDIPPLLEGQAAQIGKAIGNDLNFYGTFAIEFFLTNDNKLLVNEMAPRVHNSGHYTQDMFGADQFVNHLLAITGERMIAPDGKKLFMMRNLLAPKDLLLSLPNRDLGVDLILEDGIKLHWYGKTSLIPLRKMGHLNVELGSISEVESKKKALIDAEQKIWQTLSKNFGHLDG